MSENIYKSTITHIGLMAQEFINEGVVIVFNNNALDELADISYLHSMTKIDKDIRQGDIIILGDHEYTVTAVGNEANRTMKSMGHCTFCFNGAPKTKLPGQIELLGDCIPRLKVGSRFEIIFN